MPEMLYELRREVVLEQLIRLFLILQPAIDLHRSILPHTRHPTVRITKDGEASGVSQTPAPLSMIEAVGIELVELLHQGSVEEIRGFGNGLQVGDYEAARG